MNRAVQPTLTSGSDDEGNYLVAVSDLMVGMLFIFIIVLMAFALNFRHAEEVAAAAQEQLAQERDQVSRVRDRLAAQRDRLSARHGTLARQHDALARERDMLSAITAYLLRNERIRNDLLASVQDLLSRRLVHVAIEPRNGVLRLSESLLFETAEAVLRPDGVRALRELATVLARTLPCYSEAPAVLQADCPAPAKPLLESVLVEGHSDDRPISTDEFEDNWELASARAINTYKALLAYEPTLAELKNARGEDLLGVSSYEAHRPVSVEPTDDGRRLNRRIDLRFLIAAPSEPELTEIRAGVGTAVSP